MRSSVYVGRNRSTKPIQVDLLVAIVELKDVTNTLDRLQILISSRVHKMKRIGGTRVTIRQGEIDGD